MDDIGDTQIMPYPMTSKVDGKVHGLLDEASTPNLQFTEFSYPLNYIAMSEIITIYGILEI